MIRGPRLTPIRPSAGTTGPEEILHDAEHSLKGYRGMKGEAQIPVIGRDRLPEAIDRLIDLYTAMNKPDEVKKWQAEREKKSDAPPMPEEKD